MKIYGFSELADWYYDQIAVHNLKPMTLYCNRKIIDTYVLPYIGEYEIKGHQHRPDR